MQKDVPPTDSEIWPLNRKKLTGKSFSFPTSQKGDWKRGPIYTLVGDRPKPTNPTHRLTVAIDEGIYPKVFVERGPPAQPFRARTLDLAHGANTAADVPFFTRGASRP